MKPLLRFILLLILPVSVLWIEIVIGLAFLNMLGWVAVSHEALVTMLGIGIFAMVPGITLYYYLLDHPPRDSSHAKRPASDDSPGTVSPADSQGLPQQKPAR